jgi:hypothetical protein
MRSAEPIASAISTYVQRLPSKNVSGTQLAQFLKFSFPDFSPFVFGVPKLREFVARYVPDIVVVGRSGGDLLYGVKPANEPGRLTEISVPDAPVSPVSRPEPHSRLERPSPTLQLWKSFSSPNSLWHIYANAETGDVQVIAPGNPGLTAPWVVIPPLPPERHLQVARGFVETLKDEKQRDALQSVFNRPRWWDQIYTVSLQFGLLRNWQFYRRREIQKAFSEALRSANIPVRASPTTYSTPLQPVTEPTVPREAEQAKPSSKDDRLRRAVLSAVQAMSIAELRNLLIPVGYLADELRRDG